MLDLRALLAVLELRSFQRAAAALNMSQPALSRRIKALEHKLGATLLHRSTRKVTPTASGLELEPLVRQLVQDFDDNISDRGGANKRGGGQVSIATIPTVASFFLPAVLRRFRCRFPDTRIHIHDCPAAEGIEVVRRGEADLGINFLGASRPEFRFTPIFDDPFVVACRVDHPYARKRSVAWEELREQPLIVNHQTGNRHIIDEALARSKVNINWSTEVRLLSTSFSLVEAGIGIAVLPRSAAPPGSHPVFASVPLTDPTIHRTIGVLEHRNRKLTEVAEVLRDLLLEQRVEE